MNIQRNAGTRKINTAEPEAIAKLHHSIHSHTEQNETATHKLKEQNTQIKHMKKHHHISRK
jgi:hypothetical protein